MKEFFRNIWDIGFKRIFIAVLIAFFIWLYVKLEYNYIYQFDIPIVPVNIKEGMVIKNEIPKYATLRLEGKGSSLMGLHLLWKSKVKFNLDLTTINYNWECEPNNYLSWVTLPSGYESIEIREIIRPEMISIELDKIKTVRIPIFSENISIIPSEHYIKVGKIKLVPDSVAISGPESRVDNIKKIDTEVIEFRNKKKLFNGYVSINKVNEDLFGYDIDGVNYYVDIQILSEKTLEALSIEVTDVPQGFRARVEPGTVSNLKIRGGINFLNSVDEEDIKVEIPWRKEWKRYREYREKLVIMHPEDVISYDEFPMVYTVIIE